MSDSKIITHTTYTYETSDGRDFDDLLDAKAWQKVLDTRDQIIMLNSNFKPTNDAANCFNIYLANANLVSAFDALQEDVGLCARIYEPGYYYYDDAADAFVNIDKEIEKLLNIKALINQANK